MIEFDARQALLRASRDQLASDIVARAGLSTHGCDWSTIDQTTRDSLIEVVVPFFEADHNERSAKRGAQSLTEAFHKRVDGIRLDDANDKAHLLDLAFRYTSMHGLHAPSFTNVVLTGVLDTELCPLQREIEDPSQVIASQLSTLSPGHASAFLLRNTLSKLTWVIAAILLATAMFVANAYPWASLIAVAVSAILIVSDLRRRHQMKKAFRDTKIALHALFRQLQLIRMEVDSGAYDSAIIAERLKTFESRGGYVPSVAYGLLQLPR